MAVVWALTAALLFGTGDVLARVVGQRETAFKTLLYTQGMGLPLALMLMWSQETETLWVKLGSWAGGVGLLSAIILSLAVLCLYQGLALGPLLIVSPVATSSAAVTVVLSLLSGERPTVLQLLGLAVVMCGVIAAAIHFDANSDVEVERTAWLSPGVRYAIASALLFGVGFWLVGMVMEDLGVFNHLVLLHIVEVVVMLTILLALGRTFRLTSLGSLRWLIPMALFNVSATAFINLGYATGLTAIVSVIGSLYGIVSVIIGYIIWREQISRLQQIGIGLTFVGIFLVTI